MSYKNKFIYEDQYIQFSYHPTTSKFEYLFFGAPFLGSSMIGRIGKTPAIIIDTSQDEGVDHLGCYKLFEILYRSGKDENKHFTGKIRFYQDGFSIVETIIHYSVKTKKSKHIFGHPYISFPCFEGNDWQSGLSVLSYKRQAPFNYPVQWKGSVIDSPRDGKNTPLFITNSKYQTLILSPSNHLLHGTTSISREPRAVRCGIPRAVKKIPAETCYQTLLVYGNGVNRTIDRWGKLLRKLYNISPTHQSADASLKYISYWTNAGSAYWYKSYKNRSYETALKKLRDHHENIGLNIGLYQLDSWWYKRDGNSYISSITEWEPKEIVESKNFNAMFPIFQKFKEIQLFKSPRISYIQSHLRKPLGTHFKQISNDSVYIEGNKGSSDYEVQYEFIKEDFAVPRDYDNAYRFFKQVFFHPKWRLSLIVHDWLYLMFLNHSVFNSLDTAPAYFNALDDALREIPAEDNETGHLTLQLCMQLPAIALHAVTMKSVTSIRSTSDSDSFFVEGTKRWWWHLYSSRYINALGKYSFFDNRFSNKSHIHPRSAYSKFEFIWIGLSCGPLGIGDKIGKENMTLIRRTIHTNGEIIKPDKPCVPLDQCFLYNPHDNNAKKGVTVYSSSRIGKHEFYYLLSFNCHPFGRTVTMEFSLSEIDGIPEKEYILYDYFEQKVIFSKKNRLHLLKLPRRKFYYHLVSPIINNIAIFGDVSKHISMSRQIIKAFDIGENCLWIDVTCSEESELHFLIYSQNKPKTINFNGNMLPENNNIEDAWYYSERNHLIHVLGKGIKKGVHHIEIELC